MTHFSADLQLQIEKLIRKINQEGICSALGHNYSLVELAPYGAGRKVRIKLCSKCGKEERTDNDP